MEVDVVVEDGAGDGEADERVDDGVEDFSVTLTF